MQEKNQCPAKFTADALYTTKKKALYSLFKKIKTEFPAYRQWKIGLPALLCKCQMCFGANFKLIYVAEYFAKVCKQYNDKWGLYYIKNQRFFSKKNEHNLLHWRSYYHLSLALLIFTHKYVSRLKFYRIAILYLAVNIQIKKYRTFSYSATQWLL